MNHAVKGVNSREKVLMILEDDGWHWWVHEYDKPDEIVYRSEPFETPGDAEDDVEIKASIFKGWRPGVTIYVHERKWYWQYVEGGEVELEAGPFPDRNAANHNHGMMSDLLLCWGNEDDEDDE